MEKSSLYQKVAKEFAAITEAKMNSTGEEVSSEEKLHEAIARHPTQENNPPLSTKHVMQPPRLLLKDSSNPLSPKSQVANNAATMLSLASATASLAQTKMGTNSHAKLTVAKPQTQVQAHAQAAKVLNKPQIHNVPTIKLEAQKHKLVVKEPVATIDISKEGTKRTTTPTRKCK